MMDVSLIAPTLPLTSLTVVLLEYKLLETVIEGTEKSNDSSPTETVVPLKSSRRLGTTILNFKEHCVSCDEKCLPLDPRHPDKWRKVYQCRTTEDYKQKILLNCDEHNDDLANEVRVRLSGVVTDLHAADVQYHNEEECRIFVEDNTNELIITAEHPIPISITNGQVRIQTNFRNTQEEADVIIVNQLVYLAPKGASTISVVSDDTDIFVLLLYFYCKEKLTCEVFMQSPNAGRGTVDIKATPTKHSNIAEFLPGVHALSGCDTTSFLYGIGKATAWKVLNSGKTLKLLGKQDVPMEDILMWKSSLLSEPPEDADPVKYGWTKRNDKL
ncbi:hypothetical protein Pmani_001029 [Petrolisthes manimaculis]|uniref:Uncharacterized protein n=1 Tax=Petrolisthes manimaculis TaxID=1843537 RepID=A0AAE1QNM0_9EUCA|nr:hypothetical protein Pmani_001029 [Petrolisthes manimaculis]